MSEPTGPTGPFPRRSNLPDPSAPCPDNDLAASTRKLANLAESDYWAAICPELTVNGKLKGAKPLKKLKAFVEDAKQQINDNGVVQIAPDDLRWTVDVHCLARNLVRLMQHGWPATFLLMFDEVWALIHRASALMGAATGNACNMDVLCWYVDPNSGAAGFSPHRDRQPDDAPATFRAADGSPMYGTCWVPLTDACPENSCLYMVPRWADPGYHDGDDDDGPDPLSVALASKEDFQAIRAFPAEAGSAIIFTHRIIHWGSRGRKGYHTPRLAVSWGCADDAYEPPYFSREHLPYPPMALRAALACGQMLAYHERFTMTRRQLSLYFKFFTAHASSFHTSFRDKVASEFIAASIALCGGGAAGPARPMAPLAAQGIAEKGRKSAAAMGLAGAATNGKGKGKGKDAQEGGHDAGKVKPARFGGAAEANTKAVAEDVAKDVKEQNKKRKRAVEDDIGAGEVGGGPSQPGAKGTSGRDAGLHGGAGEGEAGSKGAKKAKRAAAPDAAGGSVPPGRAGKTAAAAVDTGAKAKSTKVVAEAAAKAPTAVAGKADKATDKTKQRATGQVVPGPARASGKGKDPAAGSKEPERLTAVDTAVRTVNGDDSEDELLEDALEAMLDAAASGKDLGHDDFDDFDDFDDDDDEVDDDDDDDDHDNDDDDVDDVCDSNTTVSADEDDDDVGEEADEGDEGGEDEVDWGTDEPDEDSELRRHYDPTYGMR